MQFDAEAWLHACSNNINLTDEKGNFLLVQYFDLYDSWARVNNIHRRLRIVR